MSKRTPEQEAQRNARRRAAGCVAWQVIVLRLREVGGLALSTLKDFDAHFEQPVATFAKWALETMVEDCPWCDVVDDQLVLTETGRRHFAGLLRRVGNNPGPRGAVTSSPKGGELPRTRTNRRRCGRRSRRVGPVVL